MEKSLLKVLPWLLLLLGGCGTVDKLNPFSSSRAKLAELAPVQASVDIRPHWQASIGAAGEYTFSPALVGDSVNGSVYVAARDGSLARFDKGTQVWRASAGLILSGGVASDGKRVVVGSAKGDVLAFDADTGRELWRVRVSSEVLAAPAFADGLVIVRSGDSRVFGLDVADGKRRWVYQRSTPSLSLRSHVGVLVAGRYTLAGFPGGKLVAIANNNGATVWEATVALPKGATELERVADITSLPIVSGNLVCAVAFQGRISCFDGNSGNTLWSREMSSSAGLDSDERHVYVTDVKGAVHAFDRSSGASVWKQDSLLARGPGRPLALGSHIAVADQQGAVHVLRREDGTFAARQLTDASAVRADLVPGSEGFLVQTVNGGIYAMDLR